MYDDVMTRNDDGELAVRTVGVTEQATVVNPNDVYTRDTDGNLCIRTTGSGGGGGGSIDPHNLGYYATQAELEEAHPTAEAGDFAIVTATNTVWVWDVTNSEWIDSEVAGQVTSVNGQTGDVTVQETLVSGTNIKTINNTSVLGSGDIAVQEPLESGTNIKTVNSTSILGSGNLSVQEPLVSGTNIKTINNNSILGSGNIDIDSLPSQTGQSGKFLSTDGTDASWEDLPEEIPSQSGQSGKFLSTDGTNLSWETPQGGGGDFVPQYTSMPVASASNVGQLVQYKGADTNDYINGYFYQSKQVQEDGTATITQTAGNADTISFETTVGTTTISGTTQAIKKCGEYLGYYGSLVSGTLTFECASSDYWNIMLEDTNVGQYGTQVSNTQLTQWGFEITGTQEVGDTVVATYNIGNIYNLDVYIPTFESQIQTTGSYVFTYDGNDWYYDNQVVNLADYGISYSGVPYTDDALTVAYTEGELVYMWQQTNAQPEPSKDIEFVAGVDLSAGSHYDVPYATIPKVFITDGTYEFYTRTKNCYYEYSTYPITEITIRVLLKVSNGGTEFIARICPVLDGHYYPDNEHRLQDTGSGTTVFISGSNLTFRLAEFSRTNIPSTTSASLAIQDCVLMSKIKNLDTGEEIVPVLSWTEPQSYDLTYGITYNTGTVDYIEPQKTYWGGVDFGKTTEKIKVTNTYVGAPEAGVSEIDIGVYADDSDNVFRAKVVLYPNDYDIFIYEATGIFENAIFSKSNVSNELVFEPNIPQEQQTGNFIVNYGALASRNSVYMYTTTESTTPLRVTEVGATISVPMLGRILQYKGTTTASYTHGYFYEATGTVVTMPASMVCTETTSTGTTITCSDPDGLIAAIQNTTGWETSYVKERLTKDNYWQYDANGGSLYWSAYGQVDPSTFLPFFSFSPAVSSGSISWTTVYVNAHKEVQNGSWELVNVQDVNTLLQSVTGYDATKTQVLKNVAGTLTWVDE